METHKEGHDSHVSCMLTGQKSLPTELEQVHIIGESSVISSDTLSVSHTLPMRGMCGTRLQAHLIDNHD